MNFFIVLIVLQAISINCAPLEKRKTCGNPTIITNVITVTRLATRVTLQPASPSPAQLSDSSTDPQGGAFVQISTSAVVPSVWVATTAVPSGTAQVLPSLSTQTPDTTGSVDTILQTSGIPTAGPILSTSITAPTSLITPVASASSVASFVPSSVMAARNIFHPVATGAPPSCIGRRSDHPAPRLGIKPQNCPLSTNKFYANFFLSSQSAPTLTHPYSVSWAKGGGSSRSWGISVSHIDANQRAFGPDPNANPAGYFINPVGIQSIVLSAAELGGSTTLTTDSLTALSVNVNLLPSPGASPAITFPLVQGMGFVTAIYNGGTPLVQTGVFFRNITRASYSPKYGITKYTILLEDGKTWLLYAYSSSGAPLNLQVVNNGLAQSTSNWHGIIQIGKNPCGATCEALYDAACGVYATTATLSGSVSGSRGTYSISFAKAGLTNSTLVMFALPHHLQSFDSATSKAVSNVQLQTTTKGIATAVHADSWTLVEPHMPVDMGFAPWKPGHGSQSTLSPNAIAAIQNAAASEVSQNMTQQTDLNSFYYSGKVSVRQVG
jgi:endo-1,3(4)-beta-glucanase